MKIFDDSVKVCKGQVFEDLQRFSSIESAKEVLKEKHFFKGQWITTLPKVNKGCWKGKSYKVKVDNVLQSVSEEQLVNLFFYRFGIVTIVSTSSY